MARRRRDPLGMMRLDNANLDAFQGLTETLIHAMLPVTHRDFLVDLIWPDADGHVRGDGRDFGDGPILWSAVKLWHAIHGRDRSRPAR